MNKAICVSCDTSIDTDNDLFVYGESLGEYWCEACMSTGSDER